MKAKWKLFVPKGWKIVNVSQKIKDGDLFASFGCEDWQPCESSIGSKRADCGFDAVIRKIK